MSGLSKQYKSIITISKRTLTLNEASNALRPFFFAVHPDRYAQHPEIRTQNEKSLQIFNGYMNDLFPVSPSLRPIKVSFSIADKKAINKFRNIHIQLSGTDPMKIVRAALESCHLNTGELKVKSISIEKNDKEEDLLKVYLNRKKRSVVNNLHDSLTTQRAEAVRRSKNAKVMQVSIDEEINDLKERIYLKDVVWEMEWTESLRKRCISYFHRFLDQADASTKNLIVQALSNNVLRFGRESFTCCDGSIQLCIDYELTQWTQIFKEHQVRKSQSPILIQTTEQLEGLLGGAKVIIPQFKSLLKTLEQIQSLALRISRQEPLFQRLARAGRGTMIEVLSSNDKLEIGADGRIFIPCNISISSLATFLEENAGKSMEMNHRMQALMNELEDTTEECIQELKLTSLKWDTSFTPDKLLECIIRLKDSCDSTKDMVSGLSLFISKHPSIHVTNDGTLSIPINWT